MDKYLEWLRAITLTQLVFFLAAIMAIALYGLLNCARKDSADDRPNVCCCPCCVDKTKGGVK